MDKPGHDGGSSGRSTGRFLGDRNGQGMHILLLYSLGSLISCDGEVQLWLWARLDQECAETSAEDVQAQPACVSARH